jgi:STE24 endopeptidase
VKPAPVSASSYFSEAELHRARAYGRPQLAIGLAASLAQVGVLAALARRPPRGPAGRPLLGAAVTGAAITVATTVVSLPLGAIARQRAKNVGLATQSWGGWAVDKVKATAISAVLTGAGAAVGVGAMRRLPRTWWLAGAGGVVVVASGFLFVGPVLLDPVFNRFDPLPDGPARADVLELARRAGIDVGEVYRVDASRRTTAANAYVTGLGATKRVVLYDTLLEHFTRDEARVVVAHELAHVRHRDVPHSLLFLAIVAPPALLAVQRLTALLAPAERRGPGPQTVPALMLAAGAVGAAIGVVANRLSRAVEVRADTYALEATGVPRVFIDFQRRIALRNLADPEPPALLTALLGTHPSTVQRIGIARTFEERGS